MATESWFHSVDQISVQAFAERLQEPQPPLQLIDVREPQEIAIARIEGFQAFPLSEFAEWSSVICDQLDPNLETVVMCHHGMRSAQMCHWLAQQGFSHVKNLQGGIDAYAAAIDPQIPRY